MPIYVTNRCNSQCLTCNIWKKKPKEDLDPDVIRRLLSDRSITKRTAFALTGGEFLLHPSYKEILSLFSGREYSLLSNAILADRLVETVREFHVKSIGISLDGGPDTYCRVRGVDNFAGVERVVRELRDTASIMIGYTANPWNGPDDLRAVMDFCHRLGVRLSVGFYHNISYYEAGKAENTMDDLSHLVDVPYVRLYPHWASGNLSLPCLTLFIRPAVMPNGDVFLCEAKDIVLGNLYQATLSEIWNAKRTRQLQKEHVGCNACWLDCQRPQDITLARVLKTFVPSPLLRRVFDTKGWDRIPYVSGQTWRASVSPAECTPSDRKPETTS